MDTGRIFEGDLAIEALELDDVEVLSSRDLEVIGARRGLGKTISKSGLLLPMNGTFEVEDSSLLLANLVNIWYRQLSLNFKDIEGLLLSEYLMGVNSMKQIFDFLRIGATSYTKAEEFSLCLDLLEGFEGAYEGYFPEEVVRDFKNRLVAGLRLRLGENSGRLNVEDFLKFDRILRRMDGVDDICQDFAEKGHAVIEILFRRLLMVPFVGIDANETMARVGDLQTMARIFDVSLDFSRINQAVVKYAEDLWSGCKVVEGLLRYDCFDDSKRELERRRALGDVWAQRLRILGLTVEINIADESVGFEELLQRVDGEVSALSALKGLNSGTAGSSSFA